MLAPSKRPLQLLTWAILTILLIVIYRSPQYIRHPVHVSQSGDASQQQEQQKPQPSNEQPISRPSHDPPVVPEAALKGVTSPTNSTLGFGAVVVVSKPNSPRRHALIQAANVTEIDLTIPDQPKWGDEDVKKFRYGPESKMGYGSILAWLGHHNALKWFLDSGLETALILEDDVDWDIHLRSLQVPLAANAARSLFSSSTAEAEANGYYWGSPNAWELLYIGHCGDYFGRTEDGVGPGHQFPSNLTSIPHKMFPDPSLPDKANLHPFTEKLMTALDVPEHSRVIHRSRFPLCTFAYAVNRNAARRLIEELAPAKEKAPNVKAPRAYDVAILNACKKGYNIKTKEDRPEGLKCYSVNPELFHHMPGDSTIANVEKGKGHNVGIPPVDLAGADQVKQRNETSNIGCGFWGGHFSFKDDDKERLRFLQQNVGQKGQCLKPGKKT